MKPGGLILTVTAIRYLMTTSAGMIVTKPANEKMLNLPAFIPEGNSGTSQVTSILWLYFSL